MVSRDIGWHHMVGWVSAVHSNWLTCKEPMLMSVPAQRLKSSICEEGWGLKLCVP